MLRPAKDVQPHAEEPSLLRHKRPLRRIGMLPTLLTLGNLCLGLGAIHMCGRELEDLGAQRQAQDILTWNSGFLENLAPTYLSIGIWMLIGAFVCDALDGRVARRTGQETKFGEQLDSLADVVSCGVAPALVMMTMVRREIAQWIQRGEGAPFGYDRFGELTVIVGIIYVCCTALRLARFNVEASMQQASHEGFRGLPSPGAAGALLSLVFLHDHLDQHGSWVLLADFITHVLPIAALGLGLLMVSRVPYRHAVSLVLRRRPFGHVIPFLLIFPLVLLYTKQVLAATAWVFVLSGVVKWLWHRLTSGRQESAEPVEHHAEIEASVDSLHRKSS